MTKNSYRTTICLVLALISATSFAACSGQPYSGNSANAGGTSSLRGLGASFPAPIYQKWVSEYGKINPNIKIDYQSQGSGAGVNAVLQQTADFGASDAPMSDDDLKKASGEILHIPTVLGAVVLTYNVAGIKEPLRLAPDTIADIYLGKIKKWNDPRIKADNQNANLPDTDILPIYRADASGTSNVFSGYLAAVSPEFKEKIGRGVQPGWITSVGSAAKGNEGVMGQVKQTPNTIGYVELTFAKTNNLPTALIKNSSNNFVAANLETVSAAAAESLAKTPEDLRVEITNAAGANAYPISSYTYILVPREQKDAAKGATLVNFLWWATHDGQAMVKDLHYAPLPAEIVAKVENRLKLISNNGQSFRK